MRLIENDLVKETHTTRTAAFQVAIADKMPAVQRACPICYIVLNRTTAALVLACLLVGLPGPARGADKFTKKPRPSANKGKRGQYRCQTSKEGHGYYVYVPETYSDSNPAGLHLYFHGAGDDCNSAPKFGRWAKPFLEKYNLIGINMQFPGGSQAVNPGIKLEATVEALAQTIADYKIVVGRGAVGCFSGGVLPFTRYCQRHGARIRSRGILWPFNHASRYDTNPPAASRGMPMSWLVTVTEKHWPVASTGVAQNKSMAVLLQGILSGGCPDVFFNYNKDKGHGITKEDIKLAAEAFHRSDLAFAPFLYAPDFPKVPLKSIVGKANKLKLGLAAKDLDKLLEKEKLAEELQKKAGYIREKIEARVEAILELCKALAENDPILCNYYGKIFTQQLSGHPRLKELKDILAPVKKRKNKLKKIQEKFIQEFPKLFVKATGRLQPNKIKLLEKLKEKAGANSQIGRMCADFLRLQ